MIIPTPDYDPMFAEDGVPFREKMLAYIQREFSDILAPHVELLHDDNALQSLRAGQSPVVGTPSQQLDVA